MLVGLEGTISRAYTDILYHLLHGLDEFGAADRYYRGLNDYLYYCGGSLL